MPVANVVIARPRQAAFFHLIDDFADETGLEAPVRGRIGQVHVPLVQDCLGLEGWMLLQERFDRFNGIAHGFRAAIVDMPGHEMERDFVRVARVQQSGKDG